MQLGVHCAVCMPAIGLHASNTNADDNQYLLPGIRLFTVPKEHRISSKATSSQQRDLGQLSY